MTVLLALAVGLLLSLGLPVQAQETYNINYPENGTGAVATFTATDPEDAGAIRWSLTGDDAEDFAIGESSGVLTFAEVPDYEMAADADQNNVYAVTVVATDADAMPTNKAVTVTVTNVDEAGTVTLSAVAPYPGRELTTTHTDLDGQITGPEWQWSRSGSKSGSYTAIENAEMASYSPTSRDVGFYLRATVTYTDGHGEDKVAMATSAHPVQAINEPNAAPAFPDDEDGMRAVEENTPAGEDVGLPVAAGDADNDILTYTLTDEDDGTDGDSASFDIEPATGQIKTKGALDTETGPTYTVKVTATDPAGATAERTVTITVTGVNEPPEITAEDAEYAENATSDVASFSATDPESAGTVTLDLSGADAALFTLTGGTLAFNDSPNFEMPGDANKDNAYELTIGARDADGNRSTEDIEVKVTNVNEAGTVTLSAVQPRVGVAVTASLTDIDGAVSGVTWQWSNDDGNITDATSDTYTPAVADVGDTLTATASYTDPQGSGKTASAGSTNPVAADTRNKPPVFADQDDATEGIQNTSATRTVAEDAAAGTDLNGGPVTATDPNDGDIVSYRLGGADASSFDIDLTTGQIAVGQGTKLDYEDRTTYMVTVIATDSFGESASIPVTITVTDVNEGPEVSLRARADVNQKPTILSGEAAVDYPENGTHAVQTYTATDPEGETVTWILSGADAGDFTITTGGVLEFASSPDYERPADADTDNDYEVTVTAADPSGLIDSIDVTVTVTDTDENQAPAFPASETGARSVPEGPVAGRHIGAPVRADDPDRGDTLTYALGGTDAASFNIVAATGQLLTRAALDFETEDEYSVTVTATDQDGLSDDIDVTITVTDVDETGSGQTLLQRYDADDSGAIEKDEMIAAINDYLFGTGADAITKAQMIDVINLYLFG